MNYQKLIEDQKFLNYERLLLKWNRIHNLGGKLTSDLIREYIMESIYPLSFIEPFEVALDIGSGAGFPAVPLAIAMPQAKFLLVEPRKKRCGFLQMVCMELGLKNICIQTKRIEEVQLLQVDLITSRAFMKTLDLIALSKKFLKYDGYFLFYKGENLATELGDDIQKYRKFGQRVYFYERKDQI